MLSFVSISLQNSSSNGISWMSSKEVRPRCGLFRLDMPAVKPAFCSFPCCSERRIKNEGIWTLRNYTQIKKWIYSKRLFANKQQKEVSTLTRPGLKRTCQDQITALPTGTGTKTIWSTSFSTSQTRSLVDKNALKNFLLCDRYKIAPKWL